MNKKVIFAVILSIVCLASMSASTFACACCADPGTYSVTTRRLAQYELTLLKDMKFGSVVDVYMTEAGWEDMRGLTQLVKEFEETSAGALSIADSFTGSVWTLRITSAAGKVGTITLPRPAMMTSRRIHIPDNTSTSPNVSLYKEWVFNGTVASGTGFLRGGIVKPSTRYTLLFQGHGNNCDNAEDFSNWRIEIKGPRADYAFFGKMKAADIAG